MHGSSSDVSHKTMTPRDTRDIATAIIDKTAAAPACTAVHYCIIIHHTAALQSLFPIFPYNIQYCVGAMAMHPRRVMRAGGWPLLVSPDTLDCCKYMENTLGHSQMATT